MSSNPATRALANAIRIAASVMERTVGEGLTRDQLLFRLPHETSNIYWLAGHLTFVPDGLFNITLGREAMLPAEYFSSFGPNTEASATGEGYPPFDELLERFREVHSAVTAHIEAQPDSWLEENLPEGTFAAKRFGTIGNMCGMTPMHLGYHTGQIALLRKAQGLSTPLQRKG